MQSDLIEFADLNSPEYYEIEKELSDLEIDVLLDDEEASHCSLNEYH